MTALYGVLALLGALVAARVSFPGLPDLSVAFFIPIAVRGGLTPLLIFGALIGVFWEGLHPERVWLAPLVFIGVGGGLYFLRRNLVLDTPLAVGATSGTLAFGLSLMEGLRSGTGGLAFDALIGALATALAAAALTGLWKREL